MRRAGILLIVTTAMLGGCTSRPAVESALSQAGTNRPELESVLNHYRTVDDNPDKLRSAEFLIENMPAHYSSAGTDSRTIPDAQVIKASYLIDNIDKAYEQWTTCPWAEQLTFDQYLEWMLPYKAVECQELDYWRDSLFARFGACLERSLKNDVEYGTVMQVAEDMRIEAKRQLGRNRANDNSKDYVVTSVLMFRSAGLPCVMDETPVGPRGKAATSWFVLFGERGDEYKSEWDLSTEIEWGFFPYERGPKVYRNTYSINQERLEYKRKAKYQYPFDLCKKDVTTHYFLTSSISIPVKRSVCSHLKDKYVYIASAVRDASNPWQIVDFGKLSHGNACFKDMGREVLYVVMGYDGKELIPITEPFILHKDESIEYVSADTISSPGLDRWKNNAL